MRNYFKDKRNLIKKSRAGKAFTLTELIIVIVVIGILATITVISYSGWKQTTTVAQLKSDLNNVAAAMENARNFGSGYPTTVPSTFTPSSGVTLSGGSLNSGLGYCVSATSGSQSFFISSKYSMPLVGVCPVLYLDASISTSYSGTGTTWADLSGNNNNGTLNTGVTYDASNGGVLTFNGTSGAVDLGNNLEWSGALTVASWYKRTTLDTVNADGIVGNWYWNSTVNNRRGWVQRYYLNSNILSFLVEVTNGSTVQELQTSYTTSINNWYYAVGVFDPSNLTAKLYVNGVLRSTATASAGYNQIAYDSSYPMRIGYNPVNAGYFTGSIGYVSLYNRVMTDAEISQNFNAMSSRY